MAKLSDEEARTLRSLMEKQKAPDTPAGRTDRVLNLSIDLADEQQVDRARKLGLLSWIAGDGDSGGDGGDGSSGSGGDGGTGGTGGGGDETPKRGGFFGGQ